MMEKRNYRKTLKFYQKLLQKEKRSKGRSVCTRPAQVARGPWATAMGADSALPPGSEVKTMLSKLKGQLEEMKSKVQFLGLVKKYLQASPPSLFPPSCGFPTVKTLKISR